MSLQYSFSNLFWSVRGGCFICKQIWDSTRDVCSSSCVDDSELVDDPELVDDFPLKSNAMEEWWNGRNSIIDLEITNWKGDIHLSLNDNKLWSLEFVLIPHMGSSMEPDPVSGPTFSAAGTHKLSSHWLQTCSESHTSCRELERELQPFVPKRLIEISTEDNGNSFSWRVVCPADMGDVPYFTLSHCWGTSQCTCLTSKNHHAFAKFTSFSSLPKTYQHAFLVTFSLGCRFIWIDSLCGI